MAILSRKDVEHIAFLARLQFTEEEMEVFRTQLDSILNHFRHLQELDTSDVPPTAHTLPLTNVFREDEVRPSLPVEEVLANAPERREAFFLVPRVVED